MSDKDKDGGAALSAGDLYVALERADRLIAWMSKYVGKMAPLDYHNCYADLNEHFMFMAKAKARAQETDNG